MEAELIVAPEARGKSPRENVENVESRLPESTIAVGQPPRDNVESVKSRLPESVIVIGIFWPEVLGAGKAGYLIFCSFIAESFSMPSKPRDISAQNGYPRVGAGYSTPLSINCSFLRAVKIGMHVWPSHKFVREQGLNISSFCQVQPFSYSPKATRPTYYEGLYVRVITYDLVGKLRSATVDYIYLSNVRVSLNA